MMPTEDQAVLELFASGTYWAVVILWAVIAVLLLKQARVLFRSSGTLKILVIVLAIDALRTLIENLYFGFYFNSLYGLIPEGIAEFLQSPVLLALPKLFNVLAGCLILFLIVRRWIPALEREHASIASQERQLASQAYAKELAEERQRLLNAQAVAKVGSWETDLKTLQVTWSAETFRIFQIDPDLSPLTHDIFLDLVHPDDRAAVDAEFKLSWDTREICTVQHRIRLADGTVKFVVERWQTYLDKNGQPWRAVGTTQDITELKRAEQKADDAESLLRVAGGVARLGGWIVNLDDERVTWSAHTAAIHDEPFTFSPTLDQALNYYIPEHRAKIERAFRRCADEGIPFTETLQISTAKGQLVWVRVIGEAAREDTGKIKAVQGAFQDVSELIAAREQSELLSQRLFETLDAINDAFITVDTNWEFTFVNREAMKVLQRNDIELIGQNIWEKFPDLLGSTFERQYRQAMQSQEITSFVEHYPGLDKWFSIRAYPSHSGLAIYFQDITPQRAQQEQLTLLENAISRLNDIVIVTEADPISDPGPRIVYVNDTFTKRTGFSREEVIGRSPRLLQGALTQRDQLVRIRKALHEQRPVRAELFNYTKGGEGFWLELDISPVTDETGRCTHFVAIERDITDRRIAQKSIETSEQRFRLVAQATADTIWDWDLSSNTIWWSERMHSQFGYDLSQPQPGLYTLTDFIHTEDKDRVLSGLYAVIEGEETDWSDEYRFLRADGTIAQIINRGSVIRNEDGNAIRMAGSIIDVTEKRKLQEQLLQSQKMETVGQLTGGIAHDFNNILFVILGNIAALKEDGNSESDNSAYIDLIEQAAQRASELTRQLLAFSRKQSLRPQASNLNELIVAIGKLLRRTLGAQIEIDSVLTENLWSVDIDRAQFESALVNLCINARDAMPTGGRLLIETSNTTLDADYNALNPEAAEGDYVLMSVTDTGYGMSPDIAAKVFEPFFTTKGVGKGTGLGLSMVYGFIRQSNGHIKIYSEVGRGTTIKIYLPRSKVASSEVQTQQRGALPTGTERLLVVEDDAQVRALVAQQLQSLGYIVSQADSGAGAVAVLEAAQQPFDLLLTDVVMPGNMNGKALAEIVGQRWPETKVVFMSGFTENALTQAEQLADNFRLLSKPFSKSDLAHMVRNTIGNG